MGRLTSRIAILILGVMFYQGLLATEYKVAVRAHHGIDVAVEQWSPTLEFLSSALPKHSFKLVPVVSLKEITERAGNNDFDFVLTNPSSFVEIAELYNARALATLNNKRADTAQSRFGSVIFTHVLNNDVLAIKDLKGKRLMAVSERAFGGWRVAWLELLEQGFDPYTQLKEVVFAKSKTQPEVVMSVIDRKVDVGVVRTDLLERLDAKGKIDLRYLRIINNKDVKDFPFFLSTRLYPEWAFAAMPNVSKNLATKIQSILFGIKPGDHAALLGKYIGWVEAKDYASVRTLMKKLKVGPYSQGQPSGKHRQQ